MFIVNYYPAIAWGMLYTAATPIFSMLIATFLFLFLYLLLCRPEFTNGIQERSYLSRERTCTINAIMVICVFFSHAQGFITWHANGQIAPLNSVERFFWVYSGAGFMGQLMVSTFLMFSGYGIMESASKKGALYLSGFMRHRFFKVFYQFELGILCYFFVALCWGNHFDGQDILLGITGWRKLGGNPTWFIVVTLLMYLIAFLGLHFTGWKRWCTIWGLSIALYIFLSTFRAKELWWYDTLLCFPAGMVLSCQRERVESLICKMRIPVPVTGFLLACLALAPLYRGCLSHPLVHNARAIVFAYGIALLCSCISFRRVPRVLLWIGGTALFPFYFYHLLVFKVVQRYTPVPLNADVFLAIALPVSILIAWLVLQLHALLEKRFRKA